MSQAFRCLRRRRRQRAKLSLTEFLGERKSKLSFHGYYLKLCIIFMFKWLGLQLLAIQNFNRALLLHLTKACVYIRMQTIWLTFADILFCLWKEAVSTIINFGPPAASTPSSPSSSDSIITGRPMQEGQLPVKPLTPPTPLPSVPIPQPSSGLEPIIQVTKTQKQQRPETVVSARSFSNPVRHSV